MTELHFKKSHNIHYATKRTHEVQDSHTKLCGFFSFERTVKS